MSRTRPGARTAPDHLDPRLQGRTYGVPFAAVWEAARETAEAMPRWTVTVAEPRTGTIRAVARTLLWRSADDVDVTVSLDAVGMTRVDVRSASRRGVTDLGANRRRIARFLHRLDRRLRRRGETR